MEIPTGLRCVASVKITRLDKDGKVIEQIKETPIELTKQEVKELCSQLQD